MSRKSDNTLLYIGSGAALLLIAFAGREKISQGIQFVESQIKDARTRNILNNLHPSIRSKAGSMYIAARNRGIPLIFTSGLRTFDEQEYLYSQGRTRPGEIITYAKPGDSFHNYGLAFDLIPDVKDWENYSRWNEIEAIGKVLGFRWGGRFKTFVDKPHFEYTGASIAQLKNLWRSGQHDGNYVRLAA